MQMATGKKLTIFYLIWNTKKCGGNKVIFEHANRLFERGHTVKIFSILGGNVDWFELKTPMLPFCRFDWVKGADRTIATFWPTAYLSLLIPAKKKFYLVLGWETDYYSNFLLSKLALFTIKLPFKFITISKFLKNKITDFSKKAKITTAPPGIDLKIFSPIQSKKTKKNLEVKRILTVISSFQLYKGIDILIGLTNKLRKTNRGKLQLVLISFEKHKFSSHFDEFIHNASTEMLVNEYRNADLFLFTSRVEGFFLPGLEAMACGCPVVMTDSGGVQEYARNRYNCLLAKNANEILEKKMVERILYNGPLRRRLILNGLKTAKKFSWENSANLLEKIFLADQLRQN